MDQLASTPAIARPVSFTSPEAATPRRQPEAPAALSELADASQRYAAAAGAYINARNDLDEARSRWQHLRDIVSKTTEADGV